MAVASETDRKSKAWQWIYEQVSEEARDPEGFPKDLVAAVGNIFAQLFRRIGDCRLPPHVGGKVANELSKMRTISS